MSRWGMRAAGAAGTAVLGIALMSGVANAYTRHFDLYADPLKTGHNTVHGWGDLNWGRKYFYITNIGLKDTGCDAHSVKMTITVPGLGHKTFTNSSGCGKISRWKKWTPGYVSKMTAGPIGEVCVSNFSSNECRKTSI
ncbi:hypothetical protein [Actinomadura violacea]|uniref:Secreted protein n=1 Tax=Actinomadura violacea TaxID=2819934 RepID=A0ABS3RQ65_9ACTN|nr:hypothetical protein [Actinomadura violacea]MBO2458884.1 hypothetical protein [Actinomadura violacea]